MPAAVPWIGLAISAASAGAAIYQGEKSNSQQKKSINNQKEQARKQAALAEMEFNKANSKKPGIDSLLGKAREGGMAGNYSTLLTSPSGVDENKLTLGKKTLLGG